LSSSLESDSDRASATKIQKQIPSRFQTRFGILFGFAITFALMPKPDPEFLSDPVPRPISSSSPESDSDYASAAMIQSQIPKLGSEY
jgi:hypothetical protein